MTLHRDVPAYVGKKEQLFWEVLKKDLAIHFSRKLTDI